MIFMLRKLHLNNAAAAEHEILLPYILMLLGVFFTLDGIGPILIGKGQYHGWLFDQERDLRAVLGVVIIIGYIYRING